MPLRFSSKIKLSLSGFFNRRVLLAFVLCSVGVLPATLAQAAPLVVITTADSGAGSLRQAISDSPAGGSIEFNIPTSDAGYNASTTQFIITLTTGELLIGSDLTINGPATAKIVISVGNSNFGRVFDIAAGNVGISNLTVENGRVYGADGPPNGGPGANGDGGGILNYGTLSLNNCTIYGNSTTGGNGTPSFNTGNKGGTGRGGGIFNSGTLSLINCTFNGNIATGGTGSNTGSAFNEDGGDAVGGGIANEGTLTFSSCTLIDNRAVPGAQGSPGGDGRPGDTFGGGLFQGAAGSTGTQNSIFALNVSYGYYVFNPDCQCYYLVEESGDIIGAVTSGGFNLVGRRDGNSGWLGSDLLGGNSDDTALNPTLGPLQDNGGPTLTMKPISGSYAIDQGNRGTDGNGQPINVDQRGDARPLDQPGIANAAGGDGSDIGAVEVGVPQGGSTITVGTTSATGASICATDDCTLQAALNYTNTANGNDTINSRDGLAGSITINFRDGLAGSISTQTTFFGLYIGHSVTIQGPGARVLALTGGSVSRIFNINAPATDVRISGLTLTDAKNPGSSAPSRYGGAIYNTGGLTLTDCTISNNTAVYNGDGAGVYNVSGATLALVRCTLVGNYAEEFGGGIYNDGAFAATDCTFSANSAFRGGGIISRFNNGASSSVLRNCTITGGLAFNNDGGQGGGGYYAEGGAPQHHVGNSIIAGNSSFTINPDVRGNFTSDGHNFIGNGGASAGFTNGVNGDQVGTTAMPKNPLLANTLANNGGPTDTRALLLGSTAIDAGDDSIAPPADQRGYTRAGISDIGAFEFGGALPAPTPINLSGTITYCTNPALPPVPNVTMTLTGTSSDSTLSDGSGNYAFSSLASGGNYTVTPTMTALAPASAGINTLDVIAIQRHYLSLGTPLTGCKLTAADVNGVGGINTLDVIAVQRFFLGQVTGTANVGKYQFSPVNLTYTGIVSDQTGQNYDALVFGDVAGSTYVHRPEGPSQTMAGDDMSTREVPSTVAAVALPEIAIDQLRMLSRVQSMSNVIVAVTTTEIDAKNKLVGFQGDLTFDERVVTFQSQPVSNAGLTGGNWNVSGNVLSGAGPIRTMRISAYSNDFTPLSGKGTLFNLNMTRVSPAAQGTQLIWAAPPDDFIFIDADLNTQKPGNAAAGSVTPSGKRK